MNIPPCQKCGACCCSADAKWVEVSEEDANDISMGLLQSGDVERFAMKMENQRCIALAGEVCVQTKCKIYIKRPYICRQVQPGDAICLEALKRLQM